MEKPSAQTSSPPMDDGSDSDVLCLKRVGRNSDWLRLYENTEVTLGRGVDATYQLLSPTCPLMISRLHCTLKSQGGTLTVTDQRSLNGVYVNGVRLPAEEPHTLTVGDSLKLGVPIIGTEVEFEYQLIKQPLSNIKHNLAKGPKAGGRAAHGPKVHKRKLPALEVEASTSRPKLYRSSSADKALARPCPVTLVKLQQEPSVAQPEDTDPIREVLEVAEDLDDLQTFSQNIVLLRQQVSSTRRQVASMNREPQERDNPVRGKQVEELQKQLETLPAKMQRMEAMEKTFAETRRQHEEQKTQQQEELLKKQLEEALQEQRKVIEELAHSRQGFEEILSAKNKELELTKEKARAQKEEVVTQMNEVLENELQCIICSEFLIEAVTLNCAHSFCSYCISQWRKKKDECPICRRPIVSLTRCLALDNCINGMVDKLSLEMKTRRQTLISERKALSPPEPTVILDDSSSSSLSGSSLVLTESSMDSFVSGDSDSSDETSLTDTGSSSSTSELE
ncbi:E3 ubiquitin-protein ligase rnf8 isoform X1 [Synchiropus splendidus]|uniref:E3 ubiquitin-protein ligase rnf8 isoform X1 n=1 Tax=Synchiropus splendidus TaxID=270530 RepID=UPI00237D6057|nr:E3 ubiquitin-protein ligase rnf8 isoform X1 [Synchiropus splendidus]XP_053738156.1 E3 ubiquitin-protein ligase rnf8 isoform X1 [Synchiropus splendidus]